MKIVCIGGGPAGLYFGLLMKMRNPAHRHHRRRAQQALRHLRLGRGVLRPDDGQHAPVGPRHGRADRAGLQPLGRHRAALQGRGDPLRRPRLRRHRPQEAAQHPAGALRGAGRRAGVRDRGDVGCRLPRRRPDHRQRRHQLAHPHAPRGALPARHRRAAEPLHLARHAQALRRLHLPVREDRARLVPGPHLQVRPEHDDLHRRVPGVRLARPRPGQDGHRCLDRLLRTGLREATCAASSC